MAFSPDELDHCLRVLQQVADDPALVQEHERFKSLVAKIHKTGKKGERRAAQRQRIQQDRAAREHTTLVRQHLSQPPALPGSSASDQLHLQRAQTCYSCKQPYTQLHHVYHMLCPTCANVHVAKRHQRVDLRGRVALITGGRIKIGYQVALRLLRDGARVVLTTRFPHDAAHRFASEVDFAIWGERLRIYALDLRHIPSVETFIQELHQREPWLDILINNAAQTIKRPMAFYQPLVERERQLSGHLPPMVQQVLADPAGFAPPLLEHAPQYRGHMADVSAYFPAAILDHDGQQLDTRPQNSWVLRLGEVSTVELLEVQLVNAIAPFLLTSQLKPLLLRSPWARRFVVQVSAMEGQFGRADKTIFHPHTNMAKAALNMLTRTSAADYARDHIYMNSVDTGWITDENPYERRVQAQQERGFYPPLDVVDGAARIYDPLAQGVNAPDEPLYGHFLKDYRAYPW